MDNDLNYYKSFLNFYYNFCYYKYNRMNKSTFIKKINKKIKNYKTKSFYRDKNVILIKKFFNTSMLGGKKESFFNHFNNFTKIFYMLFIKKNIFFNKYVNYTNILNLLKNNKLYFNFNYLLNEFIYSYNSIFDIKIIKIPKKYKLKLKKNFNYEIKYVFKEKRTNFLLKLINNFIKKSSFFNLSKKIF